MSWRTVDPEPGILGWIDDNGSQSLPAGLSDRSPIEVVTSTAAAVTVRDACGTLWEIPSAALLDCGVELQIGEQWFHETSQQAIQHIRSLLSSVNSHHWSAHLVRPHEAHINRLHWILERNGHLP